MHAIGVVSDRANTMFLPRLVLLLFLGLFFWTAQAVAQTRGYASVSGRVIDAESRRPLADAHVFIASSMIGSVTDADGRFRLDRVPAGGHRLYASMVGYASASVDTLLAANTSYRIAFPLQPTIIEGPEVIVSAERDPAWYRRLRKFTRLFIGESPNAAECEIENPEVLSFDARWWGKLTAQAREPLVISNHALGYRITYFLEEFEAAGGTIRYDGEPLFEAMHPPDSARAEAWKEARRKAYAGSFRHFMQSLLEGTYRDEGFRAYRRYNLDGGLYSGDLFGFNPNGILKQDSTSQENVLDFHGYIDIVYELERADIEFARWQRGSRWHAPREQRSLIKLTDGPTRVDAHGEVLDPYGVTVYGHFAYERTADLVPKEYEP